MHSFLHDRADPDPRSSSDFDTSRQMYTRRDMDTIFNHALMIDARAGVDDHIPADLSSRIHHTSTRQQRSPTPGRPGYPQRLLLRDELQWPERSRSRQPDPTISAARHSCRRTRECMPSRRRCEVAPTGRFRPELYSHGTPSLHAPVADHPAACRSVYFDSSRTMSATTSA